MTIDINRIDSRVFSSPQFHKPLFINVEDAICGILEINSEATRTLGLLKVEFSKINDSRHVK